MGPCSNQYIVNDSNLDIITYDDFQYLRNYTSAPLISVFLLAILLFSPSEIQFKFQYLFVMIES